MKKKLIEFPLEYWEEKSYMMVIPPLKKENVFKRSIDQLSSCPKVKINNTNYEVDGTVKVTLTYEQEDYEVGFFLGGISVPEYYLYQNYFFTKKEKEELLQAKQAITIFMKFGSNAKKSFYLQLLLASTLIPDFIGILDESAEKMLPAKWVKMMVHSNVLPSARDVFSVQAVQAKNGEVWLHTHGLCRIGLPELEIVESNRKYYQEHYNLLSTYAMYLIDKKEVFDPYWNGAYIGELANGAPVVVTCVPWTEGILEYRKLKLGGIKDRQTGHNTKTSIVFLYTSEENEKNHVLNKVSFYDKFWGENPLFFFSDEETYRMRDLARERFFYVKENFLKHRNTVLIKIGLPLPEEGKFEHIWFELLEIKGDKFKAKLTQEPYADFNIHTGYEGWYTVNDVTDWIIYTENVAISPNNVYLLENE